MKKIFIFSVLLVLPFFCQADFNITDWQYYKNINGLEDGFSRFAIDDEIFANTNNDLSDLRVIDSSGQETPYKLVLGKTTGKVEAYYPRLLNNSHEAGVNTSAILDFGINPEPVNRLQIITAAKNFQRNVTVSGSDDMKNWRVLADNAYIYDYTDTRGSLKAQDSEVNFPESVYRYLKLEISDIENDPVRISSVTGSRQVAGNTKELSRTPVTDIKDNLAQKITEIYLDMETAGMPVGRFKLTAKGENFNRGATVYASYNNELWRQVSQGYIFRYNTQKFKGENLTLAIPESSERYFKITVNNFDDAPLVFTGVSGYSTYREVVFNAERDKNYQVYYGNTKARFSVYDLAAYFEYLDLNDLKDADLSAQAANANYVSQDQPTVIPKSEKLPYLMNGGLALGALLLLFLVYRFFKT